MVINLTFVTVTEKNQYVPIIFVVHVPIFKIPNTYQENDGTEIQKQNTFYSSEVISISAVFQFAVLLLKSKIIC